MSDKRKCTLCPRECRADRENGRGLCGAGKGIRIARVGLHAWEEPCISYGKGSGTVFFSGCSLGCVFCQNYKISREMQGREVSRDRLCDIFLDVQKMGAANLNLVNPTHYAEDIAFALERVKDRLKIPVVYNTGGYDKAETLKKLEGLVDIYLPDIKYFSPEYSGKYSGAPDYFEVASRAVSEMIRQVGYPHFDNEGRMTRGVLIRHLVLPTLYRDSFKILDHLSENYDTDRLHVSVMRQYFPTYKAKDYPEISRKLTTLEYEKVLSYAESLGITHGFSQEKESAKEQYVPDFDF